MDCVLKCYNCAPTKFTNFKQQHIIKHPFNERMIGLGFTSILFSIVLRRANSNVLIGTKQSLIACLLLGTVAVPEIFNPFVLKQ